MDLYICKKTTDGWSQPINISSLNTSENEVFPVFQADNTLAFASNGLPGLGGLDIYYSKFEENTFSQPTNAQAPINSTFDDYGLIYTISKTHGYFTSNRNGNTQLDNIYYFEPTSKPNITTNSNTEYCLEIIAKDKYTKVEIPNVDIALKNAKNEIVQTSKTDAYGRVKFCPINPEDYHIDGIVNDIELEGNNVTRDEFIKLKTVQKIIVYSDRSFIIKGKSFFCNTNTPLPGINIVLENNDLAIKKTTITDKNGLFSINLPEKGDFKLYGRKENYFSQIEEVNSSNYNRDKNLFVKLEICSEETECGKSIRLNNILFDLDKYFIRKDAEPELNKLVQFMLDNPKVNIELGSHTDCRSSSQYNQILSQNRANASVDYIVSKNINRNRITAKGYGESILLNKCADGINCSEIEHQINRRTEFKVICPK